MLRPIACSLVLGAALVACSGPDTSNPVSACNSFASAVCNKAHSCGATTDASACDTQLQNSLSCAQTACPAGSTFDSNAASQCIEALNALSCGDAQAELASNTLPSACSTICH